MRPYFSDAFADMFIAIVRNLHFYSVIVSGKIKPLLNNGPLALGIKNNYYRTLALLDAEYGTY